MDLVGIAYTGQPLHNVLVIGHSLDFLQTDTGHHAGGLGIGGFLVGIVQHQTGNVGEGQPEFLRDHEVCLGGRNAGSAAVDNDISAKVMSQHQVGVVGHVVPDAGDDRSVVILRNGSSALCTQVLELVAVQGNGNGRGRIVDDGYAHGAEHVIEQQVHRVCLAADDNPALAGRHEVVLCVYRVVVDLGGEGAASCRVAADGGGIGRAGEGQEVVTLRVKVPEAVRGVVPVVAAVYGDGVATEYGAALAGDGFGSVYEEKVVLGEVVLQEGRLGCIFAQQRLPGAEANGFRLRRAIELHAAAPDEAVACKCGCYAYDAVRHLGFYFTM